MLYFILGFILSILGLCLIAVSFSQKFTSFVPRNTEVNKAIIKLNRKCYVLNGIILIISALLTIVIQHSFVATLGIALVCLVNFSFYKKINEGFVHK